MNEVQKHLNEAAQKLSRLKAEIARCPDPDCEECLLKYEKVLEFSISQIELAEKALENMPVEEAKR